MKSDAELYDVLCDDSAPWRHEAAARECFKRYSRWILPVRRTEWLPHCLRLAWEAIDRAETIRCEQCGHTLGPRGLWTVEGRCTACGAPAPRLAQLIVTTSPAGLSVRIGKRLLGTAPVQVALRPGRHSVNVRSSRGIDYTVNVELLPGETHRERIAPGEEAE